MKDKLTLHILTPSGNLIRFKFGKIKIFFLMTILAPSILYSIGYTAYYTLAQTHFVSTPVTKIDKAIEIQKKQLATSAPLRKLMKKPVAQNTKKTAKATKSTTLAKGNVLLDEFAVKASSGGVTINFALKNRYYCLCRWDDLCFFNEG